MCRNVRFQYQSMRWLMHTNLVFRSKNTFASVHKKYQLLNAVVNMLNLGILTSVFGNAVRAAGNRIIRWAENVATHLGHWMQAFSCSNQMESIHSMQIQYKHLRLHFITYFTRVANFVCLSTHALIFEFHIYKQLTCIICSVEIISLYRCDYS